MFLYGQLWAQGRDCALEDVRENHSRNEKLIELPHRAGGRARRALIVGKQQVGKNPSR